MDYKEKCKNARAFIVLLAAFITLLLNIKCKRELLDSLIIVLIVIIVFYIISSIAIRLIDKIRNMDTNKNMNEYFTGNAEEVNEDDEQTDTQN